MNPANMPAYVCHKEVRAAKITRIECINFTGWMLSFDEIGETMLVSKGWIQHFKPEVGGYYVAYEDGYAAFTPANAFELGYRKKE